jgi:hypothetical protein
MGWFGFAVVASCVKTPKEPAEKTASATTAAFIRMFVSMPKKRAA